MTNNNCLRRRRFAYFIKRNSLYIAVGLCLAILGGAFSLAAHRDKPSPDHPAESSLDERLSQAETPSPAGTAEAILTPRPAHTAAPQGMGEAAHSFSPTALPTVMPQLTPAPSVSPAPERKLMSPPADGRLIRVFSMDGLIWSKTLKQWMTHSGVDIAAQKGSDVRAVAAGTVERVYEDDMMGVTVVIDHGAFKTVSSGLKKEPPVSEGQNVEARALIGYIGDTAISECAEESHLHFEVTVGGVPVDPEGYVLFRKLED